jgi:ATP-dependent Clp protease ATP-binding subunit ClpA
MFERFAQPARQAISEAVSEAKSLGTHDIGCEHLLAGLARGRYGPAADALAAAGLDVARIRELLPGDRPGAQPLDADSLAVLGIDLDEVRRAAETAFGPGALDRPASRSSRIRVRMTADCKRAVELALRQAHRAGDPALSSGHLLIGIIDQGDNGALRMLESAQVDPAELRADTLRRLSAAA